MKRATVYASQPVPAQVPATLAGRPAPSAPTKGFKSWLLRHERWAMLLLGLAIGAAMWWASERWGAPRQVLTQKDIDAAVLHTLATQDLPSRTAKAAGLIWPSVVRVRAFGTDPQNPKAGEKELGVGSGVVIVEDGTILTNFHVISTAQRLEVTFFDGMESAAFVISTMPENDLAVIKPQKIPDDLQPATMGSSGNLQPGDEVVAVGFPFGIGPSVSAGVVSGLNRSFQPEGKMATNMRSKKWSCPTTTRLTSYNTRSIRAAVSWLGSACAPRFHSLGFMSVCLRVKKGGCPQRCPHSPWWRQSQCR